jgi:hypothetical protein
VVGKKSWPVTKRKQGTEPWDFQIKLHVFCIKTKTSETAGKLKGVRIKCKLWGTYIPGMYI